MEAQHKKHVFRFLMGLNDSYGNIIGQVLLLEPFPSISKVRSLILQEEKRRTFGHGVNLVYPTGATAMFATHAKGFNGNQGQNQGNRGNKGHFKKDKPICTYCGLSGHIADKCYKLHGYPPSYMHKGSNQAMANQVSAFLPSGNFGNLDGFALANQNLIQYNAGFSNHNFHSEASLPPQPSFGATFASPQTFVQGSQPQCPISQVQCKQLLNYLKAVIVSGLGIGTSTTHQVATVMASAPVIQLALTPNLASSSIADASNFSINPFWIPPNFTHSVFSTHIVDRPIFKSNDLILDTGTTDHMVHSVSQLTVITSTVHSYVFLPNGDQTLVTHIGIMQI